MSTAASPSFLQKIFPFCGPSPVVVESDVIVEEPFEADVVVAAVQAPVVDVVVAVEAQAAAEAGVTVVDEDGSFVGSVNADGLKHGKGIKTFKDGRVYEGEFKDGKRHGYGKGTNPTGLVYQGEFQDDQVHGKGTAVYADGKSYEGQWENGRYHGEGKLVSANGKVYQGTFKDGAFQKPVVQKA